MADQIKDGIEWHLSVIKAHAGETVTLGRSGEASVTKSMVPGNAVQAATDIEGLTHDERAQDWIIPADDYKFAAAAVRPIRGDTISQVVGSDTYVYTALPTGSRDTLYRETGTQVRMLRVHTKLTNIT